MELNKIHAAIQAHIDAKRTAGHAISDFKGFGVERRPNDGNTGVYPYLIMPPPTLRPLLETSTARYRLLPLTLSVYEIDQIRAYEAGNVLVSALGDFLENREALSAALPEGVSITDLEAGPKTMQASAGVWIFRWTTNISVREEK